MENFSVDSLTTI